MFAGKFGFGMSITAPAVSFVLFLYFATLTASLLLLFGLSFLLNHLSRIKMHGFMKNCQAKGTWKMTRRSVDSTVGDSLVWSMLDLQSSQKSAIAALNFAMDHVTSYGFAAFCSPFKNEAYSRISRMYVWKKTQIQNARSQCWNSRHRYDASVPSNLRLDAFNIYSFFTRMSASINTLWPTMKYDNRHDGGYDAPSFSRHFHFFPLRHFLRRLSPDRFGRFHPFHRQELTVRTQITHVLNLAQEVNLKEDIRTLPSQNDGLVACGGDGWGTRKVLKLDGNFHQKRGVFSRD